MYSVRYRPQAAIPALRCGISRSLFCQKKGHGVPAAWLGTKGTYPICPMLRRRYLAPLSLSRFRMALLPRQQRNGKGGERKRPAAAVYSSALKVRTAIISFACSRSRMSWSTPK